MTENVLKFCTLCQPKGLDNSADIDQTASEAFSHHIEANCGDNLLPLHLISPSC